MQICFSYLTVCDEDGINVIFWCVCSELEAMRKILHQTVARYREKKELHNKLLEHALIIEELMNEVEAENRTLANRKKGYDT